MPQFAPARQTSSPFRSWHGDHSGLRVSDLDAAVKWYRDTLQIRLESTVEFGELVFAFLYPPDDDGFAIELIAGPGADDRPPYADVGDSLKLAGWHHVCLRVESVDGSVAELKCRGVKICMEPMDVTEINRRIAFFADPWGNLFELTQSIAR